MMIKELGGKIVKGIREVPLEAARFARGAYPSFLTSPDPAPLGQEVPVFMFHDVSEELFESQLAYLRANGYRTLTMAEFAAFLKGDFAGRGPSVLLTFDDGHKSWHRTAFPLLKKYGFTAVGFLVSSFIREEASGDSPWMSWQEVREIAEGGAMTFESHTAFHDRVFIGAEPADFYRPGLFSNPLGLDEPWIGTGGDYTNRLPPGAPIYRYSPRLSAEPRFFDSPEARSACAAHVQARGGESFFQRRGWRNELMKIWKNESGKQVAGTARFETEQEQREAISAGLRLSRATIEERLQREVRHLCYPWGAGSHLAVELSRECGFAGSFAVAGGRRSYVPGDSPWDVPRLKDDYIFRQPGKGRLSMASVVMRKLRRRAARTHIY
jgi:peptidoglycan/xylan/chitin deacetylase (PgdA/CDA1 family)